MRPPSVARALVRLFTAAEDRALLLEDLAERYREVARRKGRRAARRWYWSQALSTLPSALRRDGPLIRLICRPVRFVMSGISLLDVKLAARMWLRRPGLTLVAIFALAVGIPVGLLPLHVLDSLTRPLPVEDGAKIVLIRNYDREASRPVMRPLHDFVQWSEELSSFEALGMWRSDLHNVDAEKGWTTPVRGAEVTASVFSLLRVPPLLGRPLDEADQVVGAPDVVVIGYDLWQSRLAGNPDVVGSTIRIGAVAHEVVGVMPEGFLFPYRDNLWLPFRYAPLAHERGEGPAARVMGRLAGDVSIEQARREIEVLGRRMAEQLPNTHAQLRPEVLPYTAALTDMDSPDARLGVLLAQVLAFLLLALACGNVGILILARAATRTEELAVRTALGASRLRILFQLFCESLLLAVLAAGVGLLVLQAVATGPDYLLEGLPYWVDFEVSLRTTVLALSLAVGSAALAGVIPALKATGKDVRASMQRASGGGSGIRFGKGYSTLIVSEVGISVWLLAFGASFVPSAVAEPGELGIRTDEYLFASLRIPGVDRTTREASGRPEPPDRVAAAHEELVRRLSAEPGVGPVAIASALPGMSHDSRWIEVEGVPPDPGAAAPAHPVNVARVDVGYFDALDQPILSGRDFDRGDLGEDRSAVIVNTSFVDRVLGGRNPLGRRVRHWTEGREAGSWPYEIVGVVEPLGMNAMNPDRDQGLYHVVAPGELHPVSFAVRVGDQPEALIPRLRSIVTEIDPSASIGSTMPLDHVPDANRRALILAMYLVTFVAGVAVVLSAACLYALMSFTVTERTREIGIRTALGGHAAHILATIARRAALQLAVGVGIGGALGALTLHEFTGLNTPLLHTSNWPLTVTGIVLFMIAVGTLACVKPTLRLLRIRPIEALKSP